VEREWIASRLPALVQDLVTMQYPEATVREALLRPGPTKKTTIFHEAAERGSEALILEVVELAKKHHIW
jgi:hypothetical protein